MPHRSLLVLLVAAIATLKVLTGAAQGQTPAPPPLTYERVITMTWKDLHDKILQMAKDTVFPDDKLGWKPHPDSRSVLEEFRHVTIGLEFSSAQLRGEKFELGETGAPILADCLAFLECRVREVLDGGDHSIFLGEVVREGIINDVNPLLFFRGAYHGLADGRG